MLARVDENTIMVVPDVRRHLHRRLRAGRSRSPRPSTGCRPTPDWTSTSTSTGPAAPSWRPFCAPDVVWDFRLPRVKSISTSGHKFGLAPLGAGWIVWRDVAELPDDLIFHVSYLGGDMPVFQINFSRPAGQIIAQYYDFVRLGREGYRRVHMASYDTGQYFAEEIVQARTVRADLRQQPADRHPRRRLEADRRRRPRLHALRPRRPVAHAWLAGPRLPVDRFVVRRRRATHPGAPGRQPRPGSILLDDTRDAIEHFTKHPITVPMTAEEASGFGHL